MIIVSVLATFIILNQMLVLLSVISPISLNKNESNILAGGGGELNSF